MLAIDQVKNCVITLTAIIYLEKENEKNHSFLVKFIEPINNSAFSGNLVILGAINRQQHLLKLKFAENSFANELKINDDSTKALRIMLRELNNNTISCLLDMSDIPADEISDTKVLKDIETVDNLVSTKINTIIKELKHHCLALNEPITIRHVQVINNRDTASTI